VFLIGGRQKQKQKQRTNVESWLFYWEKAKKKKKFDSVFSLFFEI
jgi:hypothetical protein